MKPRLDSPIDQLYRLPLEEFTKARNTLAKSLSGSEKKQIGSLAKPSLAMWIINQLHWQDAPTYRALVDAAEKLRAAHRSALSGHKTDTRKPDQLHRTTVEKAFAKATGIAEKGGVRVTDSVREILRRTLGALPGDEPAGRLTRPPEPAGFTLLAGIKVRSPEPRVQSPESKVKSPESTSQESRSQESKVQSSQSNVESRKSAERERREADRKARQEQKEREQREREIRKAEQALKDAERRLAELKR